jgi:hypothetical protein
MRLSDLHSRVIASRKFAFLLDDFPNAAAAYSLRKLRSAYTGNCIEVRRSSDNSLQNIGFVNNVLDTASLLSFVGAGNGFVRTWYDQSGNGVNGEQTTDQRQVRIVNSGVLEILNSKPCLNTYETNVFRDFQTTLSSLQLLPVTILSVLKIDTLPTNSFNGITFHIGGFQNIAGGSARYDQFTNNLNNNTTNRRGTPSIQVIISEDFNIPKIFASYFTTSQVEMRLNTVDGTPSLYSGTPFLSNTNFNLINANGDTTVFHASKRFLEQIIFFNDKHSDRVAIENNINNYYNIY